MENEISQLEDLMVHIQEELETRRTRLNQMQSATGGLPSEILSFIFQLVCSNSSKSTSGEGIECRNPIFTLSSVSSCWRRVALGSPELWRRLMIQLHEYERPAAVSKLKSLLGLVYERSTCQPLDIDVIVADQMPGWYSGYGPVPTMEFCITQEEDIIFKQNSGRIGKLALDAPIPYWKAFVSEVGAQLTQLKIHLSYEIDDRCFDSPRVDTFPWVTNLTVLEVSGIPAGDAFELLLKCTSLVKFRVLDSPEGYSSRNRPQISVILPNLQQLEWDGINPFGYRGQVVLMSIRVPSLHHFSWTYDCYRPTTGSSSDKLSSDLQNLLTSASTTLRLVEVYFHPLSVSQNKNLINLITTAAPQIESLSVSATGLLK
ncbi:hypothetical protein NP233_g12738 [Leucocoprinus birnbaumii]|uniref:F-box domain-containing protein n=1 Tax=Leucocoprinus birnbaumii TaxID=56174 RepID=A0AAD5VGC6_9AGAR|nr:hypothetical protein NP233_g12738 [Leucocoprinus birnbaumii]